MYNGCLFIMVRIVVLKETIFNRYNEKERKGRGMREFSDNLQ